MKRNFTVSKLAVFSISMIGGMSAQAGDLTLQPTVSSELIFQQVDSDTSGDRDVTTLRVEPALRALYRSGRVEGSFNGRAIHLERDTNTFSNDNDYLEYDFNGSYEAIERLLTLGIKGSSNYRNANTDNYLVSDFLNNTGDLSRTETNGVFAQSDFSRNPWVAGNASASYTKVKTEQNEFASNSRLNNETLSFGVGLNDGDRAKGYAWDINGDYNDTRRESALGDFTSFESSGYFDKQVIGNWAFRVAAQSESYEYGNNIGIETNDRKFDSYGAGITYRQSDDRFISLTANKANSSNEDNDGDVFPGVHVNWAFTQRTRLEGKFSQRFYGDAASLKLTHATKKIRTSLSYSEDVRNFSQLLSDPEQLGVFICPGSSFSLECYQPSSINFNLDNGEQIVQLVDPNNALEDDVVLRKGGNFEISYQSRKLTVGLFANYSEDDYLAEDRLRETTTFGTNTSYRIGVFTTLTGQLSFADIERQGTAEPEGSSDNTNFSLMLNHRLSRYFNATLGYSYIKRDGDIRVGTFGNNYTDQRLTLGLTYTY